MDRKILIGLVTVIAVAAIIVVCLWMFGKKNVDTLNIDIRDKDKITKGVEVVFAVVQRNKVTVNSLKWDFGDSTLPSTDPVVSHTYYNVGSHLVKLYVDGKVSDSALIYVNPLINPVNTNVPVITGLHTARVGEPITFTDNTQGAKEFHWKAGESGREDGTGKTFTYTFLTKGTHTVTVTDNTTVNQGRFDVLVSQKDHPVIHDDVTKSKPKPPAVLISDDQIKLGLQNLVTEGSDRYPTIYSQLKSFLCGDDKIPVTINDSKTMDFNSYTNKIIIEETKIQTLKTTRDPSTHCITNIAVTE
jgi:hypothetical protein